MMKYRIENLNNTRKYGMLHLFLFLLSPYLFPLSSFLFILSPFLFLLSSSSPSLIAGLEYVYQEIESVVSA